jgi:predicted transcriptional regulator
MIAPGRYAPFRAKSLGGASANCQPLLSINYASHLIPPQFSAFSASVFAMKKPASSGKHSSGGRRRTKARREAQLITIAEMGIEGMSQYQIAEKLGLSQPQISRDLKEIARRAAEADQINKEERRAELLRVSRLMRKKLFAAYDRSTEDKEVQTKKQIALQAAESDALNGGKRTKAFWLTPSSVSTVSPAHSKCHVSSTNHSFCPWILSHARTY